MKPFFQNNRVSLVMPSSDQDLALFKFFTKAPTQAGSASAVVSSAMPPGSRTVTAALGPAVFMRAASDISTSSPPSGLGATWLCRRSDNVAGGRSLARQNSLTLRPLFSNSARCRRSDRSCDKARQSSRRASAPASRAPGTSAPAHSTSPSSSFSLARGTSLQDESFGATAIRGKDVAAGAFTHESAATISRVK